ncbi:MAG TPA: hypothetical protein VF713_13060, partial [Thermoanaerobaculia bacterium]
MNDSAIGNLLWPFNTQHSTLNIQHLFLGSTPPTAVDFSPVAVTFQAIGTLLLALVLGQIARTFGWRYVRRWAWAWGAMFVAVMAVRIHIITPSPWPWWLIYLLAQWLFLFLLFAGCRALVDDPLPVKVPGYLVP